MKDILGLLVLVWPLTLLVLIGITFFVVVPLAVKHAEKHGRSKWRWGIGAFLLVYLPIFWDWIPTVAVHQFYCAKDSGFWVYKTLEQWKAENPGVMESLPAPSKTASPTRDENFDDGYGKTITFLFNERFNWVVTQQDTSRLLPIIRTEQQIKDVKKSEVLARYVNFGAGNSVKNKVGTFMPLKFWLHNSNCIGGERNSSLMWQFTEQFYGSKK